MSRRKKPDGKKDMGDNYFMDQQTMRSARWESARALSIEKRERLCKKGKAYISVQNKCSCGCGPGTFLREEGVAGNVYASTPKKFWAPRVKPLVKNDHHTPAFKIKPDTVRKKR